MDDYIRRQDAQECQYTFGNDEFSLEAAYHDCKFVFDGITDDDSFQEADTGLVLYYANEIIYALHEALQGKDTNVHSNNLIDRQVAIDTLLKWMRPICINNRGEVVESDDMVAVRNILKTVPSVQPERPMGHWVEIGDEPYDEWECDVCGFVIDGSGCIDPEEYRDVYRFCPRCGSDMRG